MRDKNNNSKLYAIGYVLFYIGLIFLISFILTTFYDFILLLCQCHLDKMARWSLLDLQWYGPMIMFLVGTYLISNNKPVEGELKFLPPPYLIGYVFFYFGLFIFSLYTLISWFDYILYIFNYNHKMANWSLSDSQWYSPTIMFLVGTYLINNNNENEEP